MRRLLNLLLAYGQARRWRFTDRAALEAHQRRHLQRFLATLAQRSAYFSAYAGQPLDRWPTMDKAAMLQHFDRMNTVGLTLAEVMAAALRAERDPRCSPVLPTRAGPVTVGLSSGTSGQRGVFLVSEHERARWAGVMLAKALPGGLLDGERVALCLRANSPLYTAVRHRWLAFEFFDLFEPFEQWLARLEAFQPTVLVAPAQVLRQLALAQQAGRVRLPVPRRVYAVAEVLEPQDRPLIEQAFGPVRELYQATEGFLASPCERGVLHLNEEHVHIEPHWLDDDQRRFIPVVTDFSRLTQPIVRYRLDDVLVLRDEPCACGRASRALARIEGRCDDVLQLPGQDGQTRPVFADVLTRALARALPLAADYRLVQTGPVALRLQAALRSDEWALIQAAMTAALQGTGVAVQRLRWTHANEVPVFDPTRKRRRVVREVAPVTEPDRLGEVVR